MIEGIRITVLKRLEVPDLAARFAANDDWGTCWLREGQVFEISGGSDFPKPEGLCSWAWADLQRDVTLLRYGADAPWIRVPGTIIASCTDGRKPVVFRLERIGEPPSPARRATRVPAVRIAVVKRLANVDLIRGYATEGHHLACQGACASWQDGRAFRSEGLGQPEGFCSWAWADIQRDVVWVALGGVQAKHRVPGTAVSCCTNGLHPVVFHIERVEEDVT